MLTRHGRSFEVKHLQKNRFTHPLSLSILHLEPSPRRDSNHHRNKISSLKPTGGEREVLRYKLRCGEGERCKVCSFVLSRRPTGSLAASRRWSFPSVKSWSWRWWNRVGFERQFLGCIIFQSNVIHVMNLSFKTLMRS